MFYSIVLKWLCQLNRQLLVILSGAGIHRQALAFVDGPNGYALIQRFSKINISLT